MDAILIPARTQATLEALLAQQRMAQAQIDAIVMTARDLLNVPDGWQIRTVAGGFEPPAPKPEADGEGAPG